MIPNMPQAERIRIDHVLESAVVLSWKELLRGRHAGVVHVEYGVAPEPSLQYVKIWLLTRRESWDLMCEYWMCASPSRIPTAGLTFSNGYHSPALERILEHMMRCQDGVPNSLSGESGVNLILVDPPTLADELKARNCMTEAYRRIGLEFVKTPDGAA
jgi:hypothetical protein